MIFTIFSLSNVPFPHSSPMLNHMPHHLQKWICLPQCLDHPRYLESPRHRSQMVAFVWACWKLKLPQLRKNISRLSSRWDSGRRMLFILFHFLYGSQLAIQGTLRINPVKKLKKWWLLSITILPPKGYTLDIKEVKAEHIPRNFKTGVEENTIFLQDYIYLIGFGVFIYLIHLLPAHVL